jgi:hypothetical protein
MIDLPFELCLQIFEGLATDLPGAREAVDPLIGAL